MRSAVFLMSFAAALSAAVVIDRVAVVVNRHVIKASDIDRDLRVTSFLNGEPLAETPANKRKAADRLIDQAVIREEIATGQYRRASDSDAEAMLKQIRQERFGGSEVRLRQALAPYRLTEDELRAQLLWQLTVLRFIDQRFRSGITVGEGEVRDYYNQHASELKRQWPVNNSLEAVEPKVRELLMGQRVNEQFETWLDSARKSAHIEYRQEAFQ